MINHALMKEEEGKTMQRPSFLRLTPLPPPPTSLQLGLLCLSSKGASLPS